MPRSYPAELRRKVLDLVETGRPARSREFDLRFCLHLPTRRPCGVAALCGGSSERQVLSNESDIDTHTLFWRLQHL